MNLKNKISLILILAVFLNAGPAFAEETPSETNDKPLFVYIGSNWCTGCAKVKQFIPELEYEYQNRVKFIKLDSSSKQTIEESWQKAEENGIKWFYDKYKATLPTVGIFCGSKEKEDKKFVGEVTKEPYQKYLDSLLVEGAKICSLK